MRKELQTDAFVHTGTICTLGITAYMCEEEINYWLYIYIFYLLIIQKEGWQKIIYIYIYPGSQ